MWRPITEGFGWQYPWEQTMATGERKYATTANDLQEYRLIR